MGIDASPLPSDERVLASLAAASGRGVNVFVIDSGLSAAHPWLGGRVRKAFVALPQKRGYRIEETPAVDASGHGTAVAGQIRRLAPAADLYSVQILHAGLEARSLALLAALRWVAEQELARDMPSVVNLSLATARVHLALPLAHAVDDLYVSRVPCVCAPGGDSPAPSYPARFAGTMAVTAQKLAAARIRFLPGQHTEFAAAGEDVEVAWPDCGTRRVHGDSFACGLVAGWVARALSVDPGLTPFEIKTLLKRYASCQEQGWWEDWMTAVERPPGADLQDGQSGPSCDS